jgi:hypothetical protein
MQRRLRAWFTAILGVIGAPALAADIPVAASKLSILQKYSHYTSWDEVQFNASDPAVTKGAGTDPNDISVRFDVEYGKWHGKGEWLAPAGVGYGWLVNDPVRAKFFDPDAGEVGHDMRKVLIRANKSLKLTAWTFGIAPWGAIDPSNVGSPNGPVYTAYCVTNGAETNCHCTEFAMCTWTHSGGYLTEVGRVRCKGGVGDPTCRAKACSNLVDQGVTMLDGCSSLEWEKKDTAVGSGVDASNPHDVDNTYSWAGRCSLDATVLCQPTTAAAALCEAQTGGALGCAECGPGDGSCDAAIDGAITTVWDWLDGLNAAGFGGHTDWRLPTDASHLTGGAPAELKSLADHVCYGDWCTPTALGPSRFEYWTSTSNDDDFAITNYVGEHVDVAGRGSPSKASGLTGVRAVRSAP